MQAHNLIFSDEEKTGMLKKYFRKYFNEKLELNKTTEEQKLESDTLTSTMLNTTIDVADRNMH